MGLDSPDANIELSDDPVTAWVFSLPAFNNITLGNTILAD